MTLGSMAVLVVVLTGLDKLLDPSKYMGKFFDKSKAELDNPTPSMNQIDRLGLGILLTAGLLIFAIAVVLLPLAVIVTALQQQLGSPVIATLALGCYVFGYAAQIAYLIIKLRSGKSLEDLAEEKDKRKGPRALAWKVFRYLPELFSVYVLVILVLLMFRN